MYKRYYYDEIGVNSRLDTIQAAILRVKLPHLNDFNKKRRDAARYYNEAFRSIPAIITPKTKKCGEICESCDCHVFHQYTLQITNGQRDALHQHLLDMEIPNAIYYPVPLHRQNAYKVYHFKDEDFEVTNTLVNTVLSLPIHTEFEIEQQDLIIRTILDFMKK
jgi:UDP-2-acetamido-2-deoxy-ribo-hexuluronate aminotransferase